MSSLLLLALSLLGTETTLLLENVSVVNVVDGNLLAHHSVLTRDGRILEVAPTAEVSPPEGAQRVDGAGKFLIPGLWDMHVHFATPDYAPLFVANGVVGVRDMHAHVPFMLLPLRKASAEGKKVCPRIITPITMVDGSPPLWSGSLVAGDAEAARKAVRTLKSSKADFVKIYSGLSPEAFAAICDEARELDLPVVGHVPEAVSARDASEAGVRSMEHIFGILTASADDELKLREELVTAMRGLDAEAFYAALIRSQLQALDQFNDERAAALFATFARNHTYQCPTLTVNRMFARVADADFTDDPRARYTPKLIKAAWAGALNWIMPIASHRDDQRRLYEKTKEIVARMHRAGAPILVGTDTSNPYCLAGFSLHDELALLVESGLSPLAALQAATLTPARFLQAEADQGFVAVGRRADLVLLNANPLEDIRHTQRIHGVALHGRWHDRAALDAMLLKAEQDAADKP